MELNHDNRQVDGMQILEKFVFPAVIAAGSAFLSVQLTLSTLELDVGYIKRDIERQAVSLAKVTQLQLDVTALQIEVKNSATNLTIQAVQLDRLRDRMRALEGDKDI